MAFDGGFVIAVVLGAAFVGFLIWAELNSRQQRLRRSAEVPPEGRQRPQRPGNG
jgi:hypothetical protein